MTHGRRCGASPGSRGRMALRRRCRCGTDVAPCPVRSDLTMPAFVPPGVIGHNRTIVTPHYAVLPPDGMFPSLLPGLRDATVCFQATPLMGARFAQGRLEVAPGGGTTAPRDDG